MYTLGMVKIVYNILVQNLINTKTSAFLVISEIKLENQDVVLLESITTSSVLK